MKYLFVVALILLSFHGFSQQNHFIYIQADNRQPFYIKMDKKIISSSTAGYLIIPKVRDSVVELVFGFPRNQWPEQRILCRGNNADAGFLLKNFGEKGWGLINFQSMELVMADTAKNAELAANVEKKENDFAAILGNVVEDPGLKEQALNTLEQVPDKTEVLLKKKDKPEIKPKRISKPELKVVKRDKAVVKPSFRDKPVAKKDSLVVLRKEPRVKALPVFSRITKMSGKSTDDGFRFVYLDRGSEKPDTVDVVITTVLSDQKEPVITISEKPVQELVKVAKENIEILKDTGAANTVDKKADEVVAIDLSKTIVEPVNTIKDSLPTVTNEKKPEITGTGLVKNIEIQASNIPDTVRRELVTVPSSPVIDTMTTLKDSVPTVVTEKKVGEPVVDLSKTIAVQGMELKDSAELVIADKKEIIPARDTLQTPIVMTRENTRADSLPVAVVEKKVEDKSADTMTRQLQGVIDSLKRVIDNVTNKVIASAKEDSLAHAMNKDSLANIEKLAQVRPEIKQEKVQAKPFTPCTREATGDDFLSLRKKMAAGSSDNEILFYAHKAFSKMCYTTKHIERLSLLFNSDEGKYKFFDDAYQYVSDPANFPGLVTQLTDAYYINRFKAMLR